jgi:hypothetical protein
VYGLGRAAGQDHEGVLATRQRGAPHLRAALQHGQVLGEIRMAADALRGHAREVEVGERIDGGHAGQAQDARRGRRAANQVHLTLARRLGQAPTVVRARVTLRVELKLKCILVAGVDAIQVAVRREEAGDVIFHRRQVERRQRQQVAERVRRLLDARDHALHLGEADPGDDERQRSKRRAHQQAIDGDLNAVVRAVAARRLALNQAQDGEQPLPRQDDVVDSTTQVERADVALDQDFPAVHQLPRLGRGQGRDKGVPGGFDQLAHFVACGGRHAPSAGGHERRFTLILAGVPAAHERDV